MGQLHLCRLSCFRVRMKKRANLREATPRRGKELGNLFIRFPFLPHANDEGTKAMAINITARNELLRIGGPLFYFIGVAIGFFKLDKKEHPNTTRYYTKFEKSWPYKYTFSKPYIRIAN